MIPWKKYYRTVYNNGTYARLGFIFIFTSKLRSHNYQNCHYCLWYHLTMWCFWDIFVIIYPLILFLFFNLISFNFLSFSFLGDVVCVYQTHFDQVRVHQLWRWFQLIKILSFKYDPSGSVPFQLCHWLYLVHFEESRGWELIGDRILTFCLRR